METYIIASQVGNILYLDTKYCIEEDATYTYPTQMWKVLRKYFSSYQ